MSSIKDDDGVFRRVYLGTWEDGSPIYTNACGNPSRAPVAPNPAELYLGWCEANGFAPGAQDSLVAWLRALVLPRHERVQAADHACRQLFPKRAPELLLALELAGCFD